ncbi:MAG: L,D-transpeptidase family protein [Roseibacillus sp.]
MEVEPAVPSTEPRWRVSEEIYEGMGEGKGSIEISLQQQKLLLLDSLGRVAIETDCSTGIPGRETPTGRFPIKEMIVDKRSNKYGKYVSKETGEVVVEKSWEVARKPAGTRYLGIAMPYWMRLTWDGVGVHVGAFPRGHRSSFGCIRMPEKVQPLVYQKCRIGMPVTVKGGPSERVTSESPR